MRGNTNWRDDYDFPMSWDFWRAICIEHGFDPGDNELPEESVIQPEWTNRQWDKVQQLESEVVGWREKHATTLLEIDKLKVKVDRGTKKYKYTE